MNTSYHIISGRVEGERGERLDSRILEERIQEAVTRGYRHLVVKAAGQQGIGGRLGGKGNDKISIRIQDHPGQRVGAMGFPNTEIEVMGPASDDVGWLNVGAHIIVQGHAGNGVANAMAQGRIYINGNIGARGMTMTKSNPRFDPPELWVLGSAGDYFGEFMAGGICVVCGFEPQNDTNVLGYRPLVGMVGGKVFFRGKYQGLGHNDAKQIPIENEDQAWLENNLREYLERIGRPEIFELLADKNQWQLLTACSPHEKRTRPHRSMRAFNNEVWEKELGQGGLIGDLTDIDRSPVPVITTGVLRRQVPVWENRKYAAPCESTCPSGIPVQERWRLIREGRIDEAIDLALAYTPFPATVCGYLCPNPCMQACTRQSALMTPVDVTQLGKASIDAHLPELPPDTGKKIAVIGGGPAGISVAWQLRMKGHQATIYDFSPGTRTGTSELGGKIRSVIPSQRIPEEVITAESERVQQVLSQVSLEKPLTADAIDKIRADFDFIVLAIGAQKPRTLAVPGHERTITALDFLLKAKQNKVTPGKRVVIIGAGNVGCDVAVEAHRLGAEEITLIDIMEPASFGKERQAAEAIGAIFKWPCFTQKITEEGVKLKDGGFLYADTVAVSIGDAPDLKFLPDTIGTEYGFVKVNELNQTSDSQFFAIGDVVKPGLITDAIGSGRRAANAICDMLDGKRPAASNRLMIDINRITLEYFDPRTVDFDDTDDCGAQCASCGTCRDCGICVAACPQTAISREENQDDAFEYVVNDDRCIACGFCAQACPCGIWNLVENDPIE
jgi:NADPH-dependent glutamate synthase beta subunit-like oxidoreductase/glutamate synthase domain-containing protein 3/NAD-dependent dihydropyrimidine dehydrogenase PreA subunit